MGKLMEQVSLELNEENEIKRIREANTNYIKRVVDEKQRIIKVEEEEIKKKRDNVDINYKIQDNIKKLKKAEKTNKANAQKKIISRLFSKQYFKNMKINTLSYLEERGLFNQHLVESTKDKVREVIHTSTEKYDNEEDEFDKLLDDVDIGLMITEIKEHKITLDNKQQFREEEKKKQDELKLKEEEEAKIKLEGKYVRAREKKILRLKNDIQKAIFDLPALKNDIYTDDVSEIDNYELEGGYSNINC